MSGRLDFDVAILGAGLAGLSLAVRLAEPRFAGLRVLVVEPRTHHARDRTWSFWSTHPHPFQAAVACSWSRWAVTTEARQVVRAAPGYSYDSIPADCLYDLALARLAAAPHVTLRLGVHATALEEDDAVVVRAGGRAWRCEMVFDTRPVTGIRRRGLMQIFGGMEIETSESVFDPNVAVLMDFRTAQAGGAHFTYVLPSSPTRALVEDTWLAPPSFQPPDHRLAVQDHLRRRFGVERFKILFCEQGALPMDPGFEPQSGRRLLAFGVAGGAMRPSTGYAFNAIQAHCDAAATALAAGSLPLAAPARPAMARMMDHVLLDMLSRQPELAPRLFSRLFERCSPAALIRFLNDCARPADFMAVAAAVPFRPTMLAALKLAAERMQWSNTVVPG